MDARRKSKVENKEDMGKITENGTNERETEEKQVAKACQSLKRRTRGRKNKEKNNRGRDRYTRPE